ncbi:MAG: glycosyltransferase, partial [Candidatus Methanomethylicia archaeon]
YINGIVFNFNYEELFNALTQLLRVVTVNNSIEIVHAHFAVPYGLVGNTVARILRRPLIITVHGFDILMDKQLGYGINRFSIMRRLTRFILSKSCKVIANSLALKRECVRHGVPPSKVVVIPYGVNIQMFYPMSNSELEEKLPANLMRIFKERESYVNILCAKRLEKIYGIEYLIKAIKVLINKGVKNFRTIFVGGGNQFKNYLSLVNQLGLSENVIFFNLVPRKIMPLFYNICDFTVVPSMVEGFGLVVAESLACGRPVIGTSVGGILDQVIDGFNGFLVPSRDFLSLADRIQTLIQDDDVRKRMSCNARVFAESHLDLRKRILRVIDLYRSMIENDA